MPRGDRTGPWGQGPMTGRGTGYCAGFPGPGFMSPGSGLGFGRGAFGRGFGRGRGWRKAGFVGFGGYPYPPMRALWYPHGMDYTPEYTGRTARPN